MVMARFKELTHVSTRLRGGAATLLASVLLLTAFIPAAAAAPPLRAADADAPGGRLVVLWRDAAPNRIDVAGVRRTIRSETAQRSVAIARAGQSAAVAARLRADPRVLAVVPDAVVEAFDWPADGAPNDPRYPEQEDLPQIGVPSAWPTTTGDPDVVVAIIDTGFDQTHPDLAGVEVVAPRNETWNNSDVTDTHGHGTHVAGTIFARTNNTTGIAGIAPDVTFMPIKVLDDDGFGFVSDVLDAVDWARTNGADIINLSLGGPLLPEQVALFQPTFSAARAAGILVVAAAGNSASPILYYPASLNGVVSVSAVDAADEIAWFSTFNRAVDLAAPGEETLSTSLEDPSRYERASGTSMSSPHVVGVAALVLSARPALSVQELEAVLRASAVDLGDPGRDDLYGSGRIDAAAALTEPVPDPIPELDPAPPDWTGPLTLTFTAPTAAVSQTSRSYTVSFTTSHPFVEGYLLRYGWQLRDGKCPNPYRRDPWDFDFYLLESPLTQTGLRPGNCYRWEGIAYDEAAQFVDELSAPVTILDLVRPTIVKRVPAPGATGVARSSSVRIKFSEQVVGVSAATLRLKNLKTGLIVRARVSYDARTRTATIDPALAMYPGTRYRVIVKAGIRDPSGNTLARTRWGFRTAR